jgi:hypothetical protein
VSPAPRTARTSIGTERRIGIQIHKGESPRRIHFAPIHEHTRFARELAASTEKIYRVSLLPGTEFRDIRPGKLAEHRSGRIV